MFLKNPNRIAVLLILTLIFFLLSSATKAEYGNVGVRPGDWMTHVYVYMGSGRPINYQYFINRTVLSIHGGEVELIYIAHWTNGTTETKIVRGNVSRGAEYISPVLIPPNLDAGEHIHLEIGEGAELDITFEREFKGNVTLTRDVMGAMESITVERTLISASFTFGKPPWPLINATATWDKATGILVFMYSQHERFNSTSKLFDTNAFMRGNNEESPQLSYHLVAAVATVITLVILITYAIFKPKKEKGR